MERRLRWRPGLCMSTLQKQKKPQKNWSFDTACEQMVPMGDVLPSLDNTGKNTALEPAYSTNSHAHVHPSAHATGWQKPLCYRLAGWEGKRQIVVASPPHLSTSPHCECRATLGPSGISSFPKSLGLHMYGVHTCIFVVYEYEYYKEQGPVASVCMYIHMYTCKAGSQEVISHHATRQQGQAIAALLPRVLDGTTYRVPRTSTHNLTHHTGDLSFFTSTFIGIVQRLEKKTGTGAEDCPDT